MLPQARFGVSVIFGVLPAARLALQHHDLMPQCDILRLKLAFRFDWRSQNKPEQP
jgi:hypothetical protein